MFVLDGTFFVIVVSSVNVVLTPDLFAAFTKESYLVYSNKKINLYELEKRKKKMFFALIRRENCKHYRRFFALSS